MLTRAGSTTLALALLLVGSVYGGTAYYSPDRPTAPGAATTQLPWEVYVFDGATYGPAPLLSLPGSPPPAVSALHKLDQPGAWLVSPLTASTLGGALATFAEPRDVLIYQPGPGYSPFFCGGSVSPPVPSAANVDAAFIDPASGGDSGDLILSFDIPVELPPGSGVFHLPADLVRYTRTGPGCASWTFVGREFDASTAGAGIPSSVNLIGAARRGGRLLMSFDVPVTLSPSASSPSVYVAGEVAAWDGATFDRYQVLPAWPTGSLVDALSCHGNPGRLLLSAGQLELARSSTPGNVLFTWPPSCSSGGTDFAVYEGTMGFWSSHQPLVCSTGGATSADLTPGPGNRYYLVVPHNDDEEGSYGLSSAGIERPPASGAPGACRSLQLITPCP